LEGIFKLAVLWLGHATAGFFKVKQQIPRILAELNPG
jgi:hypothetical protein